MEEEEEEVPQPLPFPSLLSLPFPSLPPRPLLTFPSLPFPIHPLPLPFLPCPPSFPSPPPQVRGAGRASARRRDSQPDGTLFLLIHPPSPFSGPTMPPRVLSGRSLQISWFGPLLLRTRSACWLQSGTALSPPHPATALSSLSRATWTAGGFQNVALALAPRTFVFNAPNKYMDS